MTTPSLAAFFAQVAPFLEGRATHHEAVAALWREVKPVPDAERLAIYGRFCRIHRFEAVDAVYAATRAAIEALHSHARWEELVEEYFRAHPMHHVEINENGDQLAPFLEENLARFALPRWIRELAEFDWWEWRTIVAPDDPRDANPREGPQRLATTVELRAFEHDLCAWLDTGPDELPARPPAPEAGRSIVLFWRNPDLHLQRANASDEELQVLKLVHEGASPKTGASGEFLETLADLREAGIILGNNP